MSSVKHVHPFHWTTHYALYSIFSNRVVPLFYLDCVSRVCLSPFNLILFDVSSREFSNNFYNSVFIIIKTKMKQFVFIIFTFDTKKLHLFNVHWHNSFKMIKKLTIKGYSIHFMPRLKKRNGNAKWVSPKISCNEEVIEMNARYRSKLEAFKWETGDKYRK